MDPEDSVVLYNLACNYSNMGKVEQALDYLSRAAEVGAVSADWMKNDKDLANLHGHPRYAALVNRVSDKPQGAPAGV